MEVEQLQLENFPDEIWIHIFQFLPPEDLLTLNYVSRDFLEFSNSNVIWQHLVEEQWKNKTAITKEELTSFGWHFRFKEDASQSPFFPRFEKDGVYLHEGISQQQWNWCFVNDNNAININNFPDHICSRTEDWGWKMENYYVSFTSFCESIDRVKPIYVDVLEYSNNQKVKGNELYSKGKYRDAICEYKKAVMYITGHPYYQTKKETLILRTISWSNISACFIKMRMYDEGNEAAQNCLNEDPGNMKSLFRKAFCLVELNKNLKEAKSIIQYLMDRTGRTNGELVKMMKRIEDLLNN
eukprot:gene8128-12588_t